MRLDARLGVALVVLLALLVGIGAVLRRVNAERARGRSIAPTVTTTTRPAAAPARRVPTWDADEDQPGPSEQVIADADPLPPLIDARSGWEGVDFDEIRRALPDSLYWKMAFPTQDPALIEERQQIRTEWNVQYGKVLSNTATDEEIDAYYATQQRVSEDYVEFLVYLADHYKYQVPREAVGALKLAGELHLARLEEIPRRIAEAKERHAAHEEARRLWLEQQESFSAMDPSPP